MAGLCGALWAQSLLISQSGAAKKAPAIDTVFVAGGLIVQFRPPQGWQGDTFVAVVRSPLGIVARKVLLPATGHKGTLQLSRPGIYLLTLHHRRTAARIWAFRRLYVLAPPYNSLPSLKAYHNALVARTPPPPVPPTTEKDLQEALESLHTPMPGAADVPVSLKEEDFSLPEADLDESNLPPTEEPVPELDEEDSSD